MSFIRGKLIISILVLFTALPMISAQAGEPNRGPAIDYVATAQSISTDESISLKDRLAQISALKSKFETVNGLVGKTPEILVQNSDWKAMNGFVLDLRSKQELSERLVSEHQSLTAITNQLKNLNLMAANLSVVEKDPAKKRKLLEQYTVQAQRLGAQQTNLLKEVTVDTERAIRGEKYPEDRTPASDKATGH